MPMTTRMPTTTSRRLVLRSAAMLAVAAAARRAAAERRAPTKLSQREAQYQPTPKYGQSCAMCQLFRPPDGCQIVAGDISPGGWCKFFSLPD
jgi:hypothetical protein